MQEIDKQIKEKEDVIEHIKKEKHSLILKLEQEIKELKQERTKKIEQTRKKYLEELEKFEKYPTDKKMFELLDMLKVIYLKDVMSPDEQIEIVRKQQCLFDYIYAKKDLDLIERYLLAKMSLDAGEIEKFAEEIEKYKKHIEVVKGKYTYTKQSLYRMDTHHIFAYEIQQFMYLLGELDFQAKPQDVQGIYKSKTFEKYKLRAIAGAYGWWSKYIYYDGEFGHKDYERECYDKAHDKAYLQKETTQVLVQ